MSEIQIWLSGEERLFRRSCVISGAKGNPGNRPKIIEAKGQACSSMKIIFPCKIKWLQKIQVGKVLEVIDPTGILTT